MDLIRVATFVRSKHHRVTTGFTQRGGGKVVVLVQKLQVRTATRQTVLQTHFVLQHQIFVHGINWGV